MSFSAVIGQPLAVTLCQRWLAQETTQPLLFYGPEGVGKRTLALQVAKALNCESPRRGAEAPVLADGCDLCPPCRKIAAGNHPDVHVVGLAWQALERKEPLEKQQNLRLETILMERHRLFQSPVEGRWKVLVLDDCHRLTADAANVLLKVLEEPPAHTAMILLTPFRDRLFSTILSRCQPVRFRPLADDEMTECLGRLGPDAISTQNLISIIELSQGSPGRALHMSREEQIQAHEEAELLWQALPQKALGQIIGQAEGRGKGSRVTRPEIEARLHGLLIPAARALRQTAGVRSDFDAPNSTGCIKIRPDPSRSVQLIQAALTQLQQNLSPALVYDNLLLQLARAQKAGPKAHPS